VTCRLGTEGAWDIILKKMRDIGLKCFANVVEKFGLGGRCLEKAECDGGCRATHHVSASISWHSCFPDRCAEETLAV
jgi:hypothetical protein